MNVLLDTHIVLQAISETEKLDSRLCDLLVDPDNVIYYSMASVWEIAIKHKLHPEIMPIDEEEFVNCSEYTGFVLLPIMIDHIYALKTLLRDKHAPKHNDPFDRLLIAQAKVEKLTFITHDSLIPDYHEPCVMFI